MHAWVSGSVPLQLVLQGSEPVELLAQAELLLLRLLQLAFLHVQKRAQHGRLLLARLRPLELELERLDRRRQRRVRVLEGGGLRLELVAQVGARARRVLQLLLLAPRLALLRLANLARRLKVALDARLRVLQRQVQRLDGVCGDNVTSGEIIWTKQKGGWKEVGVGGGGNKRSG